MIRQLRHILTLPVFADDKKQTDLARLIASVTALGFIVTERTREAPAFRHGEG